MRLQFVGLIGLGLICAVCATLLVMFNGAAPAPVNDDVEVIVAGRDIEPMTKVTEDMCESRKTARAQAPKSSITTMTKVVGQVITVKLVKGQPFTEAVFAPQGSGFFMASNLPPGKRAFPIAVAEHSVLEGLLYPGSNVDVIVSFDMRSRGEGRQGILSKTLLRNIMVLSVDNQTMASSKDEPSPARPTGGRRNITLLATPEQCERLRLAMDYGNISLALRGPTDTAEDVSRVTRLEDIGLPPEMLEEYNASTKGADSRPVAPVAPVQVVTPAPVPEVPTPIVQREPEEEEYEVPMWVTTVLRGGTTSTSSFPIPGAEPVPVKKPQPKKTDKNAAKY